MRHLSLLLLISLCALCGCAQFADAVGEVIRSPITESFIRGVVDSALQANTDLSASETAALAGVAATGFRSLVAKPIEALVASKWGSRAAAQ